jgi:leucyl aminopeptidase
MGPAADLTEEKVRQAGGQAWTKLLAEKCKGAAIHVDTLTGIKGLKGELSPARLVRAFAEGLVLGAYQFNKHKSKGDDYAGPSRLTFVTTDRALKATLDEQLARVRAIAEAVTVTRDWSNEPPNTGTPEFFAAEARRLGREYGLKVRVLNEADCKRERMGLFLAVGQGSEREGRVVVVEYSPKKARKGKTVSLVGKGITFDTGGISIKPAMKMEDMKHDMTGAATVMGAVILAAQWKVSNRVIGVMGFTENMPDGNAVVPGAVVKSRSGKTVEIINTDAEGRLILADLLDYAQDMKPDVMINIATLTGACGIALGKLCAGMMGNDDATMEALVRSGNSSGERLWQLPLWDEYFDDMKSDSADMKNVGDNPMGGTIRGGIFLKQFIRKGMPWAHLDIAYTGSNVGHLPYFPKRGASGQHVRTLAQFAADF